ncbi:MAG: hypothetical protein FJY37_06460 [Betaproteobacteria bacterium]|nr:hypothetical protein [Betaproteobacteria bacterium]
MLTEALSARGVQVERPVELTAFGQDGSGVCATLRHQDGTEHLAEAAYLIGCDGARSTVRRALGIPMEGESHGVQWQTADIRIDWEHDGQYMLLHFSENGFAFIMPVDDGRWRLALGVQGVRVDKAEDLALEYMQDLLTNKLPLTPACTMPAG